MYTPGHRCVLYIKYIKINKIHNNIQQTTRSLNLSSVQRERVLRRSLCSDASRLRLVRPALDVFMPESVF